MFIDWGGRTVFRYWGNVLGCGKSGFTVNRGAVNRGFTVYGFHCCGLYVENHTFSYASFYFFTSSSQKAIQLQGQENPSSINTNKHSQEIHKCH